MKLSEFLERIQGIDWEKEEYEAILMRGESLLEYLTGSLLICLSAGHSPSEDYPKNRNCVNCGLEIEEDKYVFSPFLRTKPWFKPLMKKRIKQKILDEKLHAIFQEYLPIFTDPEKFYKRFGKKGILADLYKFHAHGFGCPPTIDEELNLLEEKIRTALRESGLEPDEISEYFDPKLASMLQEEKQVKT